MRWAGWAAGICCGLVACGGSAGSIATAPPDAGTGSTGSSSDAGPGDAGPVDAGPSADCIGIVPATPGSALTFSVGAYAGQVCVGATSDALGVIAAEMHDGGLAATPNTQVEWREFGTNGAEQGSFMGAYGLVPQPNGFEGYSRGSTVASGSDLLWNEGGGPGKSFTIVEAGALVVRAYASGSIAIGATSTGIIVHRVDETGAEVANGSAQVSGAFQVAGGAEDASGGILALYSAGTAVKGIWFELAKGTSGLPFDVGTASQDVLARSLAGGGIAVRLDGHWTSIVQRDSSALTPAPDWMNVQVFDAVRLRASPDFTLARGGKAYAIVEAGRSSVDLVSTSGSACGELAFSGVSSVSIGADGTVIGASGADGCTKLFWRAVLK